MRLLTVFIFWLVTTAAMAQSFTMDYTQHGATTLTSPTLVPATNFSVFTYYGLPVTNYSNGSNVVCQTGVTGGSFAGVQAVFDLTGTNCELLVNDTLFPTNTWTWAYWELTDGNTTSIYTNEYLGNGPWNTQYIPITFTNTGPHHLKFAVKGNFSGVNVTAGNTITQYHITPKPNLLMVLGDSYTAGYEPNIVVGGAAPSYIFSGWVWQLAKLVPNTIAMPSGGSGTGFVATNGAVPNYGGRVVSDICEVYSNAISSGLYNQIFITASGTINDDGKDTNTLYINATDVYSKIIAACPTAHVFVTGNWYANYGHVDANQTNQNKTLSAVAAALSLPYFSPCDARLLDPIGTGNYSIFMGGDSAHPRQYGYSVMAGWLNTNLNNTFGTNWDSGYIAPTYYSLTVNNGTGTGSYTNGQSVSIIAGTIANRYFTNWSGDHITNTNLAATTVDMPSSNLVVTANFYTNPPPVTYQKYIIFTR